MTICSNCGNLYSPIYDENLCPQCKSTACNNNLCDLLIAPTDGTTLTDVHLVKTGVEAFSPNTDLGNVITEQPLGTGGGEMFNVETSVPDVDGCCECGECGDCDCDCGCGDCDCEGCSDMCEACGHVCELCTGVCEFCCVCGEACFKCCEACCVS